MEVSEEIGCALSRALYDGAELAVPADNCVEEPQVTGHDITRWTLSAALPSGTDLTAAGTGGDGSVRARPSLSDTSAEVLMSQDRHDACGRR